MQDKWDEKYTTQVEYFSHVNTRWKVSHLGEAFHLGEMFHLIQTAPKITSANNYFF